MTQHKKIFNILSDGKWHCTNEMYASYIADPRTRIAELKKKGYVFLWQWCKSHPHKKSKEWQLIGTSTSSTLTSQGGAILSEIRRVEPPLRVFQSPLIEVKSTYSH